MSNSNYFEGWKNRWKRDPDTEIYLHETSDRRKLVNVPDPTEQRNLISRRGINAAMFKGQKFSDEMLNDYDFLKKLNQTGKRFEGSFPVSAFSTKYKDDLLFNATSINISISGMLMSVPKMMFQGDIGNKLELRYIVPPGILQEGLETNVKMNVRIVNIIKDDENVDMVKVAVMFDKSLEEYVKGKKWHWFEALAILFIFVTFLFIFLMRVESVEYFFFNVPLYTYSIIASVFLISRYLFAAFYRNVPIDPEFNPGVSIIIPCFNEERWIAKTIRSCLDQHYDLDKLEVIVVDDGSSDLSVEKIREEIDGYLTLDARFQIKDRLKLISMKKNEGKRQALINGVEVARFDLIAFVDSDSFLDPLAIKHLVQPFRDPKMGGVTGRTDVENKWTNWITKMQVVRYYISFRIFKTAESVFDAVTCLSGPLSLYRKELIMQHKDAWLNQKFLFNPATFGDDRSLTNFILKKYRTCYQDEAVCSTMVPSQFKVFMKQQMRWKRSWLRESLRAGSFMWRKEPLMAFSFYMGLVIPVVAPFIVIYNILIMPLLYGVFPVTYIMGLVSLSLLMSSVYLLIKKSSFWVYGGLFCIFYVAILLWQMPIAYVTFWKSSWGTRLTANDVQLEQKKAKKKATLDSFDMHKDTSVKA